MPKNVFAKILSMNLLADPLFFLPTFYVFKEGMQQQRFGTDTVRAALACYRDNCFDDWYNTWTIWFPGHAVTYGLLPPAFRLPWMSLVSFGYVCVLSLTRGRMDDPVSSQRQESTQVRRYASVGIAPQDKAADGIEDQESH